MGHQAILYGRIQEDWEGSARRWPIVPEYNGAVLEALPDGDHHWPFLTRHLFAVAARPFHGAADRGEYRGRIIHFAASVKDDPDDPTWPDRFLGKLEGLVLSRLLWTSAKVHFESAFSPERAVVYRVDRPSLDEMYRELEEQPFATRIMSTVRWLRRESSGPAEHPDWLR